MKEIERIKNEIIEILRKKRVVNPFFLPEFINSKESYRRSREKINEAINLLLEEDRIRVKRISSWPPEEIAVISIIEIKERY